MLRNKLLILWLTVLKKIFPNGVIVPMKHKLGLNLKFWFDSNTDNGFILGFYEPNLCQTLSEKIKPNSIFYDLGAHWGYFSLLASKLVGQHGHVYAFEPYPSNFQRLSNNIKINQPINVTIHELAVSNSDGFTSFSDQNDSFANSYLNTHHHSAIQVETICLLSFVKNKGNPPPDFIKIDVEGAEFDVLKGAKSILEIYKPVIHLSTHEIHNPGVDKNCVNFLKNLNYKIEVISQHSHGKIIDYLCQPNSGS